MDSDSPPTLGIVGLGGIGHYHAELLVEQDAELVGGADISGDARREFSEAFNVPTYEQADELMEIADALFVTTPNRFHEEYTTRALEAGLDVLLEKPLAHTLESAQRIVEAARAAEGFCMVGFNNRFSTPVEVIKAYQADGRFGEFTHIEANYVRRRGIPGRGSWFTSKEVAGGGALIDIGVHAIDLALYFLDFPTIAEVSGTARSKFGNREDYAFIEMWGDDIGPQGFDVDDSASAFIRTAAGQTISLDIAWAANRPTNDEFMLRGTEAGASFDRANHELTIYEDGNAGADHLTDAEVRTRARNTHKLEQEYFIDNIGSSTPERNTVDEGLAVQKVIDAIYRSANEGRAVSVE
ncbi:MAG: Gfo/Idh/MocA family protein [Halohasta sp.]